MMKKYNVSEHSRTVGGKTVTVAAHQRTMPSLTAGQRAEKRDQNIRSPHTRNF